MFQACWSHNRSWIDWMKNRNFTIELLLSKIRNDTKGWQQNLKRPKKDKLELFLLNSVCCPFFLHFGFSSLALTVRCETLVVWWWVIKINVMQDISKISSWETMEEFEMIVCNILLFFLASVQLFHQALRKTQRKVCWFKLKIRKNLLYC